MNRALKLLALSLALCSPAAVSQTAASQPTTPDAQVRLGNEYLDKHDYGMALTWFRKAADQGNAAGENNVGWFYEKGFGLTQNYAEALNWYHKAADAGSLQAQENLGKMYQNGLGTKQDYHEALVWYRKAADQGSASAMTNLGWFYNEGWGVQRDYGEALKWYTIAADKGDSYAENDIGVLYEYGEGVAQDYSLALAWYYRAANKGLALAETNLAVLYRDGHGVQQDYARAASWFRKAADQGDAKAQFCLGWLFQNGLGVQQDYNEALNWYRKAAEQNYAGAENNIGWLYQKGLGVPQNSQEAIGWYRKAAAQDHARAKVNLAALLEIEAQGDHASAAKAATSSEKAPMLPGGIQAPHVIKDVDPEYSDAARKAMVRGTELLSLLVDDNGQPQNIKVLTPLGYGLDENAMNAIKAWRFAPGTKDGKPIAVQVIVEVSFHLYHSGIGRVDVEANTRDGTIDAYLSPIVAEAGKCWSRVTSDEKRSPGLKQARLTVQFAISRDGHVHTVEIVSSSGDEVLDGMARECTNELMVNKPLPPNVNRDHLVVNVSMLYNMDGLSINPSGARLVTGEKEQFYISTAGELSQSGTWSVTGVGCTGDACGTISPEGLYTAPSALPDPPFVRINAALPGANPLSASCIVTLCKKQETASQTSKR